MEGIQDDKYSVPPLTESPWLITTHSHQRLNKLEKQTFRTNAKTYVKTIPELHRNIILGAHQGWLILRDRVNFTFYSVWNPVTSQLIRLPELEEDDDGFILPSACIFTSSPNNPELTCVLVLFFKGGLMFSCRPTMSCNCNWVKQTLELYGISADIIMADVIEGVIYAYACTQEADRDGRCNHFVRMDVVPQNCSDDSNYSITLEPMTLEFPNLKINFPDDHRYREYMVECYGVLYYMYIWIWVDVFDDDPKYMDIVKVMVWKLDFSKMEWIKIDSLKNRALLVDTRSCTWCPAPAPSIDENCIYILEESRLYSYNLQDDSYTVLFYPSFSPDPTFVQFFDPPVWFMPSSHQRLSLELDQRSRINEKTEDFQGVSSRNSAGRPT
ncbi:hypothetical protein RND81_09G041100 [Saponaria officinalis]|uniref:KIB1-4 beta-propeller domain-containing protein n=1 Tax=Saponaria officinalis TaxID=3572 RepID=A0AAW1IHV1_SAPOF